MFGFGWTIALGTNVNFNKLKTTWKKVAFAKIQREAVGVTDGELVHVDQRVPEVVCPADNVIHDDVCVCAVVD